MAPKRAAKGKAEKEVAEVVASDAPAKKKGGKAAKPAPEKPVEDEAPEEVVKNGTSKKGKKGESEEAPKVEEAKSPAKRGRKPKADNAAQPPAKKSKNSEPEEEAEPEPEVEPEAKSKRGRKPAAESKPAKGKKAKEAEPVEEVKEEEEPAPEEEESKQPAKRGRKAKQPAEPKVEAEKPAAKKRGAKVVEEPEAKKTKTLQNKTSTDFASIDYNCDRKSASGKSWNFKISSWNVDGIRAWLNKGGLEYIHHEKPDILCLQEIKCSQDKLPSEVSSVPGYHAYWLAGKQEGYAGVCIYTKKMAINVTYGLEHEDLDEEGRIITAEYEQFYLICTYVPNAGRGLVTLPKRLQWNDEFRKHVKKLDSNKPVIICGDMNVSHLEIDLANPKTNKKNAGFTQEERDGMTTLLGDGFIDTFRNIYPDKIGAYTFWTYMMNCRAKNVGWRLDYAIVSERMMPSVCDNIIRSQVFGSDHCPITLFLHINGREKLDD